MNMEGIQGATNPAGSGKKLVKIAIIGVGGGGSNAVDNMITAGVKVDMFMAINTDYQALSVSKAEKRIQIGSKLTGGFGAGANSEIGKRAAEECKETLASYIKDMNLVFITAGMGGGTGTGAAPVIAEIAHDLGILTIAFVTTPFVFEGEPRMRNAQMGLANLRKFVDSYVIVPNERLASVAKDMNMTTQSAFQYADDVLRQGVQATTDLIVNPGKINVDFADIRTILTNGGETLMGIGRAGGTNRAVEAVKKAVNNAVLGTTIEGATRVIINVEGMEVKMQEVQTAVSMVRGVCAKDANIIFGTAIVPALKDDIQVTIIATGFNRGGAQQPQQQAAQQQPPVQQTVQQPQQPYVAPQTIRVQADDQMTQPIQPAPQHVQPDPRIFDPVTPPRRANNIALEDPTELTWLERISRKNNNGNR